VENPVGGELLLHLHLTKQLCLAFIAWFWPECTCESGLHTLLQDLSYWWRDSQLLCLLLGKSSVQTFSTVGETEEEKVNSLEHLKLSKWHVFALA